MMSHLPVQGESGNSENGECKTPLRSRGMKKKTSILGFCWRDNANIYSQVRLVFLLKYNFSQVLQFNSGFY
ncbi:hypothetical protein C5167_044444 [Papaver somniferum]|uniref:Uncharacterized protein n=1 Tax=Papaver somniferum TaxID=3469 RepID=A0A4Y7LB35_PAPSO|nr:hypothetical protein C5167_044444 [Papaver somniferum]